MTKWLDPKSGRMYSELPKFSTDIASAWMVVEEMREKGCAFSIQVGPRGQWTAAFENVNGDMRGSGEANTASRAICLAALRAVRVKTEN